MRFRVLGCHLPPHNLGAPCTCAPTCDRLEALASEKAELEREFEEIKRQLEEDADREIEELKEK